MSEPLTYMGYLWLTVDDGIVTIGVDEDAASDLTEDLNLNLPEQDDVVMPGKVCGEIESESGTLNIYSPVAGTILEVNEAVLENPQLLLEDPTDEGWLIKIESDDPEKLDAIYLKLSNEDDEDDEEEEDDLLEDGDPEDETA